MSARDEAAGSLRDRMVENQRIIDELNAQLARKTDEVRIIQEISSEINSTLELDRILEIILDAMDSVLGFSHSMILLAEDGGETLTVGASRGYPESGIGAELPVGQGVLGVVAKRRRIMRMGNIQSQMAYLSAVRERMEAVGEGDKLQASARLPGLDKVQSQIGIPLVVKDRLVGVFGVESADANAFDELDEMLMSIVANQVANAIDNARLHQSEIDRARQLDGANAELSRMNETLEASVEERTAELSTALDEVRREKGLSEDLLRRMAPPAVIPLMLEDKLEARRLEVTVLFTDLQGFTAYSAGMEPDEVFSQLNDFFSWAGDIVQRYRGYVNKTNGDGIMALFGVPFESATHGTDAALAGVAMQAGLRDRFAFDMRIGINTGTVTAGMLGPRDTSLYDVLGEAVNLAARMETLSPVGGVAVSPATADGLKPCFDLESLGQQEVKGVGAMSCFNVTRIKGVAEDTRRIDATSRFAAQYLPLIDEIEGYKRDRLGMVDLTSIQARDAALNHNEAVASFALALLREMRAGDGSALDGVDEDELVLAALLHDVGKHAIEPAALNHPSPGAEARDRLRRELLDNTLAALERLGLQSLAPVIGELYRLEGTRGAEGEYGPAAEILAAADIYDALTAPKIYKGTPWRIVGALEELLRLPYCRTADRPVFQAFVELMKPKDTPVSGRRREQVILR